MLSSLDDRDLALFDALLARFDARLDALCETAPGGDDGSVEVSARRAPHAVDCRLVRWRLVGARGPIAATPSHQERHGRRGAVEWHAKQSRSSGATTRLGTRPLAPLQQPEVAIDASAEELEIRPNEDCARHHSDASAGRCAAEIELGPVPGELRTPQTIIPRSLVHLSGSPYGGAVADCVTEVGIEDMAHQRWIQQ